MRKRNERPMRVTVSNEPNLTDMEKLAVLMGVPQERVVSEVIRRMKQTKGETR